MNGNMKLSLELLANNRGLRAGLNTSRRDVHSFVAGARREFEVLKGAAGSLQGRLAALGFGLSTGRIVMDSARLDKSLTQIGQTAGASAGEVGILRSELFRLGRESGQRIDDLKDGFNILVQSGLDMAESRATLDGVNIAMAVTGSSANTLAAGLTVAAKAFEFDLSKPGQALELLDKMTVAGRLGNAELEDLSQIFARIGMNARAAGLDFSKTLGFVEALSMVERQPERLATLAESTLRVFTNMNYMKAAQQGTGIRFYDKDQKRRDPLQVLSDIKKKYDTLKTDLQRDNFISAAFGKADLDTIKGIRTLLASNNLAEVGRTAGLIKDASGTLKRDFGAATRNLVDQFGMLKNDMRLFADDLVRPMNETLGLWIQFMRDKKENGGLGMDGKDMVLAGGTLAIGTMLAARYGSKGLSGLAGKLLKRGGTTAAGVAEGKALQYATGVTPVFVVNADAIGGNTSKAVADAVATAGGGAVTNTAAGAAGASMLARIKDWWKIANTPVAKGASYLPMLATRAGFVGAAAGGGYLIGTGVNKGMGAIAGASSHGRYKGDGWLGEMLYDLIHRQGAYAADRPGQPVKNEVKVEINFDELLRPMIRTRDMNTNTSVSNRRGGFMSPVESALMAPGY